MKPKNSLIIAVIGLGYVGSPLAIELSKKYPTIGFDMDDERIKQLNDGIDKTLEVSKKEFKCYPYLDMGTSFNLRKQK